jgi:hypothetical protein
MLLQLVQINLSHTHKQRKLVIDMMRFIRNWMHCSDAKKEEILNWSTLGLTGLVIFVYLALVLSVVHGAN